MAKEVQVIPLPSAEASPTKRNNELHAWLGGTGSNQDIRSITWAKETKQWIMVTIRNRG